MIKYAESKMKQVKSFYSWKCLILKFIYSEKATKFCEISTLLLSYVVPVKSNVEILQNFVAFSEYINFNGQLFYYKFKIIALAAKLYFENTG